MEKYRYLKVKRFLDIILSLSGLIVLAPVFLILIAVIKIDSPGTAMFTQRRIGMGRKEFLILKFRTMRKDAPNYIPTYMLENPEYHITRVGKFLRKTSLDELPQLINILKGDMSVVGPRPVMWNETALIEARQRCGANQVPPGITGWAQVNGRDQLTMEEKVRLDGYYVEHLGFWMDFRCLLRTVIPVLTAEGVVEGRSLFCEIRKAEAKNKKKLRKN